MSDREASDKCKQCGKGSAIMLQMDNSWWLCVRCWLQGIGVGRPTKTRSKIKDDEG